MRKVFWKRTAASAMAAALVLTGVNTSGIGVEAKAETVNLFTDGDLGDDGSDFWSDDRVWYFTDGTWNAASEIKYDQYAGNGTDSGLGIYYGNADGTVGMYQTVASIEAGTYELTGDVKETNGKGGTVKGFYGSEEKETAESAEITNDFGQFQFTFTVDEAETDYQVGLLIESEQGAWVCLDSLSLTKTADKSGDTDETENGSESGNTDESNNKDEADNKDESENTDDSENNTDWKVN